MSWFLASLLATPVATPVQIAMSEEIVVAQRFIAAVQNKDDYRDSDFIKPLAETDKRFLSAFSQCRVARIGHMLIFHPKRPNTLVEVPGSVAIRWKCKKIPKNTPTDFSLTFKSGKIEKIETHLR